MRVNSPNRSVGVMLVAAAVLLAVIAAAPNQAHAQAPDCSSPQAAVRTWLANLQRDHRRPDVAAACFDWEGAGVAPERRRVLVEDLKRALDARGQRVPVEDLPDADAVAAAAPTGRLAVFPGEDGPELWVARKDGKWLVTADSISAIDEIYDEAFPLPIDEYVRRLPIWMRDDALMGVRWWQLFGLALAVLLSISLRWLLAWLLASQGNRVLARLGRPTDRSSLVRTARPIGTMAAAAFLAYVLPFLQFGLGVQQALALMVRLVAAIAAVMLLYRFVDLLSDIFAQRAAKTETKLDDQLVPLVRRTLKLIVVVMGVIFVLQNMNVDVTSLLAMGTVGTLAISLAAQDTIGNLFGSFSIFTDRPFQVGDWVVIGDTEGVVEEVGMRSTRVRTFYNSVVTMPNSKITSTPVDNYGARKFRRTNTNLSLTYDTSPEQIQAFCDGVRAILKANPLVRQDLYYVHFRAFGPSSLDIMLYFFLAAETWSDELRERHNIFLEILRLAAELRVEFAFPTQTLHVASAALPEKIERAPVPSPAALGERVLAFGAGGALSRPDGPKLTHGFMPDAPEPEPDA